MPPNPLRAAWRYLRGADLMEQKLLGTIDDFRAWPFLGTDRGPLIHGPNASAIVDYANGYGRDGNSAVFACLTAIATSYPEAPLRVFRGDPEANVEAPILDHPLEELFVKPNPHMTGVELWWWTQYAKHADGNAYLRKIRSGHPTRGNVVELWPVSPRLISPVTIKGSGDFISYYLYRPTGNSNDDERIEIENIVQFRLGLDDRDLRLGCSPIKRLIREVSSDEEATAFADALLRNFGVPGLLVKLPDGVNVNEDQALALKARVGSSFGSGNRGNVGVLDNGATMEQFGFSPEQLDMKVLHRIPEERISAVTRVPAIIAGLGAGLDRATYANFAEARAMFVEQTILPLYAADAATVNAQLLTDFTTERRVFAAFDTSRMRALQTDENEEHDRVRKDFVSGLIGRAEARQALGLPAEVDPTDWLLIPTTTTPTQAGDEAMAALRDKPTPALPALPAPGGKMREIKSADLTSPAFLAALRELALPSLQDDLTAYMDGARKRTKRRILEA